MGAANSTEAKSDADRASREGLLDQKAAHPSALLICGPSGVGKGTLINKLRSSSDKFGFSCSHTTRSPRPGETNGKEYYFTTQQDFERGIAAGEFLEYAHVHNHTYGTSFRAVEDVAAAGRCCILDIDVQGARKVRESSLRAIFVFIAPPSLYELEQRLRGRGTESEEQIQHRLAHARKEVQRMREPGLFDYIVVNEDIETALTHLNTVATRALAGQVGNGSKDGAPVALSSSQDDSPPQGGEGEGGELGEAGPSQNPPVPSPKGPGTSAPQTPSQSPQPVGIARWKSKVALVTGASAGIGWATCQRLALEGMRVVAVARRRERLEALQQNLVSQGVPIADFLPVVCDITKEAEVVALPRIIVKRWPGAGIDVLNMSAINKQENCQENVSLDALSSSGHDHPNTVAFSQGVTAVGLINNAGMGRNNASLFDGKTSSWVEMISTNVLGPCMCTREALQDMQRRGQWGHIINISSMAGHRVPDAANSGSAFYSATKHALRALTEGIRQEARGKEVPLRVSQISPGMVETEFDVVQNFGDDARAQQRYRSLKCLQPEDVADAVVWAIGAPDNVDVHDVLMRPVGQKL